MSRLSLDQLTQAHLDQLYDALDALADNDDADSVEGSMWLKKPLTACQPSRTSWAKSTTWIGCGSWSRLIERDGAWCCR